MLLSQKVTHTRLAGLSAVHDLEVGKVLCIHPRRRRKR